MRKRCSALLLSLAVAPVAPLAPLLAPASRGAAASSRRTVLAVDLDAAVGPSFDMDAAVDLDAAIADDDFLLNESGAFPSGYARRRDDSGARVDEGVVAEALAERSRLRDGHDYAAADAIAAALESAFGVRIDDAARQWWCARPARGRSTHAFDGDATSLDAAFRRNVETILARRAEAQRLKDFLVADALRDELRVVCGVEVNDRYRVWRLASGSYSSRTPNPRGPRA